MFLLQQNTFKTLKAIEKKFSQEAASATGGGVKEGRERIGQFLVTTELKKRSRGEAGPLNFARLAVMMQPLTSR